MTTITRSQFCEVSKDCLKILVDAGLIEERLYPSTVFQQRFDELLRYCGIQVDNKSSAPTSNSVFPSQYTVDTVTLRWALKLNEVSHPHLHYNETLNLLRSYIVDILIDEYGASYQPLRLFNQRWGCYRLWVELAEACQASHIAETRNFWRDQAPEHFEEDEELTTQPL